MIKFKPSLDNVCCYHYYINNPDTHGRTIHLKYYQDKAKIGTILDLQTYARQITESLIHQDPQLTELVKPYKECITKDLCAWLQWNNPKELKDDKI